MTPSPTQLAPHPGTNPHAAQPTSLAALGQSLWRNRQLIVQMTQREVVGRYKGSFMGLAWSFFNPLFMLVVYTFVFSEVLKARWNVAGSVDSKTLFAMVLFVVVLFGANISVFQTPVFSWFDFITGYLMIPGFVVFYLGHKYWNKTRLVPLKQCNFELD